MNNSRITVADLNSMNCRATASATRYFVFSERLGDKKKFKKVESVSLAAKRSGKVGGLQLKSDPREERRAL